MRYALRNQSKIKEAYSEVGLNEIKRNLDALFKSGNINTERMPGEKYETISLPGISFYLLEIKFDIYKLALKNYDTQGIIEQ